MEDDIIQLMEDLGRKIFLRRVTTRSYDPATSSAGISRKDESGIGFLLNYNDKDRDGTLVHAGDRRAVIKADGMTKPEQNDIILVDCKEYMIVNVRTVEESGVALIYSCQVRG